MIIHVPEAYYSDEYMHSALKNKSVKEMLKKKLGCDKLAIRYDTKCEVYCSDPSKNELANALLKEL